jgi:hypothetical protein
MLALLLVYSCGARDSTSPKSSPIRYLRRCGWLENPAPGNVWLKDRDGEWEIAIQGGRQAEGNWPDFPPGEWVVTNAGDHGYGCACLDVQSNSRTKHILRIKAGLAQPLRVCRDDKKLAGMEPKRDK